MILLTGTSIVRTDKETHDDVTELGSNLVEDLYIMLIELGENPDEEHSVCVQMREETQECIDKVSEKYSSTGLTLLLSYLIAHLYQCHFTYTLLLMIPRDGVTTIPAGNWASARLPTKPTKVEEPEEEEWDGTYW